MPLQPDPVPPQFNLARYCLASGAPRKPGKPALIVVSDTDAAEPWSYAALDDMVRRVAAGLLAHGLVPGERIMIRMENTSDYPLLYFGAIAAGLVAVPTSAQLTVREARFILDNAEARALACTDTLALPDLPAGVALFDDAAVAALKTHSPLAAYADTQADDPAFLIYTSGTSGTPKGVLHAQRSAWGRRPMYQGWYGIHAEDVMLHAGAFNWTYTLGVGLTDPWANGATTVVYNGPKDPGLWPALIARHRASLFAAVPSLYRQILKYADLGAHDLSSLRHGLTAGEALSPALAEAWQGATGTVLYEALGMSECSTYISSAPGIAPRPGSPGRPQPGRRVAILPLDDADATPLPAGETGLLAVHRSDPGLMLGYWRRPEEDAAVRRGDWFVGGDLAAMDADGYVWFKGRHDDVMNAFGYRVSPEEVEAALLAHPDVVEAAVTDVMVRTDVRVIAAFVVARETDAPPGSDALLAFAGERLAAYKVPRAVHFVDRLPRTPNGKVIRRALAALADPADRL